jgi:hypothetical protein
MKTVVRAAVAVAGLVLLAGCNGSFSGKGRLVSSTGVGQAPLSFKVVCPIDSDTVKGVLAYRDGGAHVQLNGRATHVGQDSGDALTCDGDEGEGHYVGSYTSRYGAPGSFELDFEVSSPICGGRGLVTIKAIGGVHDGYANTSCFRGHIRPLHRGETVDLSEL